MNCDPFFIVKEFSDSPSEQHRKNAATALAVLADDEKSLRELFRLALSDKSPDVWGRAENEIADLPKKHLETVLKWLRDELEMGGPNQLSAYRVLGRLRKAGVPIELPAMSILRRVPIAKRYRDVV